MNYSVIRSLIAATALCCLTIPGVHAQESATSHGIEKYLDSQTVVVGWIDISKIDLQQFAAFQKQLGQSPQANMDEIKATRDALVQLKVNRVYWISDLASLMKGPESVVIPTPNSQAVAVLLKALNPAATTVLEADGECLIGTTKQAVTKLRDKSGDVVPRLLDAMASVEGSHGIVLAGPDNFAASMSGMMLAFASTQGEAYMNAAVEMAAHVSSIQWVSLSLELPPTSGRLHIEMKDAEAANQLAASANTLSSSQPEIDAASLKVTAVEKSVQLTTASVEDALKKLETLRKLLGAEPGSDAGNSMKQLALAMHNFHDSFGAFPAQSLVDKQGKRLLSWRVMILPYLDQSPLYQEFHLDEAWDSEHNRKLIERMPTVFRSGGGSAKPGTTRFVAPLTNRSMMGRVGPSVKVQDITDGTSNTIWLVQADESHAVTWTKPDDLVISEKDPIGSMIEPETKGFWASLADGSARFFSRDNEATTLMHLFSIDGGEVIDSNALK